MAQDNFARALSAVLRHEGGYADHPRDPGGATNMGITRKTLASWRKVSPWWNLSKDEVKRLTQGEAGSIYRANYWNEIKGDSLPAGLDYAVMDYAVNSGPGRAAKLLQSLVGVAQDGQIGPVTLLAVGKVHSSNLSSLINAYCDARLKFLSGLSTFPTFGRGWKNRVADVRKDALLMLAAPVPPQPDIDHYEPPAAPLPIDTPDPVETPAEVTRKTLPSWLLIVGGLALVIILFIIITRA